MDIKIPYLSKEDLDSLDSIKKIRLSRLKERIDNNAKALKKWMIIYQEEEDADMKIAGKTEEVVNALKERLDYLIGKFEKLAKRFKVKIVYKPMATSTASGVGAIIGNMVKNIPVRYSEVPDTHVSTINTEEVMSSLNEYGFKGSKDDVINFLMARGVLFSYDKEGDALVIRGNQVKQVPILLGELVNMPEYNETVVDTVTAPEPKIPEGFIKGEDALEANEPKTKGL